MLGGVTDTPLKWGTDQVERGYRRITRALSDGEAETMYSGPEGLGIFSLEREAPERQEGRGDMSVSFTYLKGSRGKVRGCVALWWRAWDRVADTPGFVRIPFCCFLAV